jgi:hypothetical protein
MTQGNVKIFFTCYYKGKEQFFTHISQFVSLSHEKRQLGYVFENRENPRNMYEA